MASWVYEQGKAAGKVLGKANGKADAVLNVLQLRGLSVPDEARERILACTDIAQLDAWLERALVAARVEEILNGH